jgi:hypothetical protein
MTALTLEEWIEREFSGHGAAVRGRNEKSIPGEPFMSMATAKDLTRRAVEAFSLTSQTWRDALLPFAKIELPPQGTPGTWVARTLHCNDQVTAAQVIAAREVLNPHHTQTGPHFIPPTPNTNGERDADRAISDGELGAGPGGVSAGPGDRDIPVAAPAITEGEEDAAEFYERQREELLMDPPLPEPIAAGEDDVVVPFTGITKLDLPAERIIGGAAKANLDAVVIIGFDGDGDFFFSANKADGGEVLWLMELARKKLMEIGDQ